MGEGEGAKRDHRNSVRRRQHTLRVVYNGNDDRIALRALEEEINLQRCLTVSEKVA